MDTLSVGDISLRLLASVVTGAVVGWERESRGRPAGFRTTILACSAAAVSMILSDILYTAASPPGAAEGTWRPDPARLGAGILTGIGFLGAGTIIRHENFVRGVTTAASLWFVTVMGLAFGSGHFAVGWLSFAVALLTLFVLPHIEQHISSDFYATVHVTIRAGSLSDKDVLEMLRSRGAKPIALKADWNSEDGTRELHIEVKCKRPRRFDLCSEIVAALSTSAGITRVTWS